jgi:hypothetical protein
LSAPKRSRSRAAYFQKYNAARGRRASAPERTGARTILGIDGEGYTLPDGSHRYVYMAASSRQGLVSDVRNPDGLTAKQVFAFLLALPRKALLVGFALGYDRTKWVESWPDERVWRLMRPEARQGESGPLPVDCEGYRVNLVATRLGIKRKDDGAHATVWDLFKFFQCPFVKALSRWDVGTKKEQRFIAKEKERRGNFAGIGAREERYCQLECRLLAELAHRLVDAHEQAGIGITSFYGPGSTAAVVLKELMADAHKVRAPERMHLAVACAYFGGRFECSRVGPVPARALYAYDIASAYPHAFTRIPCLKPSHGHWVHRKDGSLKGRHAVATLVRFDVRPHSEAHPAWGPLPHRMPDGNILFPLESAGGWAWREEFEAGRKLHPGVKPLETWTWRPACRCKPPFAERVRELFELRKAWGKGARGLVLKLALNSLYGKSAQRAGSGRFRCMVRAGLVTSMTRARLLDAVRLAPDPWCVLELATDSVLSTKPIPGLAAVTKAPELGAWESKPWEGGIFLQRPGVRFPLRAARTKAEKASVLGAVAARGLGVATLNRNRGKVLRAWAREPMASVTLATPSFFHGAKLSIRTKLSEGEDEDRVPVYTRDALYGRWTAETRTLSYKPTPKRESVTPEYRLTPWRLPRGAGCESVPYGVAGQSAIGDELDAMRELDEEQPDRGGLALL